MGKRTGSGGSNPMMAQRRAERKREIEKNKKKREGYREAALKYADPEKLQLEISQLQRQQLSQTDAKQDNLLKKRLEELQKHLRVCLAKKAGDEVPEDLTLVHVSGLDFLGEEEEEDESEEGNEEEEDTGDEDEEDESWNLFDGGKEEDGEEEDGDGGEGKGISSHPPLPSSTLNSVIAHATGNQTRDDDSEWEFEEDGAGDEEGLGGIPVTFSPPSAVLLPQAPYFPPPPSTYQFPPQLLYPLPPPFPLPPEFFPPPLPLQVGNYQPATSVSQTLPQKRGREVDRQQAFKPGKRPGGKPELDANDPLAKAYSGDKLVHLNRTFDAAPTVASVKTDPVLQKHLSHPPSFLVASFPPPPPQLSSAAHATTTNTVTAKQPPLAPPKLPPGMKALVPSALRRPFMASSGGDAVKTTPHISSAPAPASLPTSRQTLAAALSAPVAGLSSVLGPRGVAILRRPEGIAAAPPPPAHPSPAEDPLGAFFAELEELTK